MPKKGRPGEDDTQRTVVRWLRVLKKQGRLQFCAIPNGLAARSKKTSAIAVGLGLEEGAPDLLVWLPGGRYRVRGKWGFHGAEFFPRTVAIEMKEPGGGIVSNEQASYHKLLRELGFEVYICTSLEEVADALGLPLYNPFPPIQISP